jgi:hypothetical protein
MTLKQYVLRLTGLEFEDSVLSELEDIIKKMMLIKYREVEEEKILKHTQQEIIKLLTLKHL